MPVLRISLARFDAAIADEVRQALGESRETLEPAVRALPGNLAYHAGHDPRTGTMSNVSLWETLEDAERMAGMREMAELGERFAAMGVRFERPITNHDVLWSL